MKSIDDMHEVKLLGISRNLTEHSECNAVIYIDNDIKYNWYIWIHPPIERDDLMYFQIYRSDKCTGRCEIYETTHCTRISIKSPEYIYCSDSSKNEWFLNKNEKKHLCEILTNDIWEYMLYQYEKQVKGWDGKIINISDLPIPDYMQLPEV